VYELASRRRNQPAPPRAVFDDLSDPHRQPVRPWLHLQDDEIAPSVVEAERPNLVVWSSIWVKRPDALIRFDLVAAKGGTDLTWSLRVDDPPQDERFTKHICQRIGELVNANLRYTYGQ
jgi:hypothetical protein